MAKSLDSTMTLAPGEKAIDVCAAAADEKAGEVPCYLWITVGADQDTADSLAGVVEIGFTDQPVPVNYRATAIPGVYVLIVDSMVRGLYVQRKFARFLKKLPDGRTSASGSGGTRLWR